MAIVDDLYVKGFPFPCAILLDDDTVEVSGGALFPAPRDTISQKQLSFYQTCKSGWYICPIGYAVYSFILIPERNVRLVVFGLKVVGISKFQGKSEQLSIKTSSSDIERLAKTAVVSVEAIEARLQSIVSSGVHEFRNVNKDLYNTAYHLEKEISSFQTHNREQAEMAKSIVELSEMMKSRADIFDVITNPSIGQIKDKNIHVYKAFDRARKSIATSSSSRKVTLRMVGSSNSRAYAVQMFDVVPYIILQNSVKYSPDNSDVQINVNEDEFFIYAHVESWGPALESDELSKVFQPGFRGKLAINFESQGSGMGLFVVRRLIDFCEGASVKIRQEDSGKFVQQIEFRRTKFSLALRKAI